MVVKAQIVGEKKFMSKRNLILIVVFVLAAFTLISCVRTVGTGKIGVVTQYGRVTGRELTEGLSIIAPWGLNNVAVYDVKVQKEGVRATAASKDLQDVASEIVLNYNIERGSVSKIHQTVGVEYVDKIITPAMYQANTTSLPVRAMSHAATSGPVPPNSAYASP